MSRHLIRSFRGAASPTQITPLHWRSFSLSLRAKGVTIDSSFISQITAAEKLITKSEEPTPNGPTAVVQSYINHELTGAIIHDITEAETRLSGNRSGIKGGPTSVAQSILTQSNQASNASTSTSNSNIQTQASGVLDSNTISKITEKEKSITGSDEPVQGGPTAKAQQHSGEPITSQALHDITEGEKVIAGGERIKGGPTSKAQSELAKSRQ